MTDRTCKIETCAEPRSPGRKGWCGAHYLRWYRHGDPLWVREAEPRPEVCAAEGCDRARHRRDWCARHYKRWLATGDVHADIPIAQQVRHVPGLLCAVEDCDRPREKREWCGMHYDRWYEHGDPLAVAWIRGDDRARLESYVDRSGGPDACHPWGGWQNPDGYGWMKFGKTQKGAHVVAWELENGPKPPGIELDHECHNQAMRDGTCRPGKCPHRLCCNLAHLVPRTRGEHRVADVRLSSSWHGEDKGHRKLTEAQVLEMFPLLRDADSAQLGEIARRYSISRTHAYRIRDGKAWGWLTDAA